MAESFDSRRGVQLSIGFRGRAALVPISSLQAGAIPFGETGAGVVGAFEELV